jgi:GT2 family glycosyltransferase
MSSISVVIPTWNRRALLETLILSLAGQTVRPVEVVVVDNGSEDDSAAVAGRMGARVVQLGKNLGFAAAVNRGIEESIGDWVAIVNNDVEPEPDWLERLIEGAGPAWFAAGKLMDASRAGVLDGAFDEITRSGCACRCGNGSADGPLWNVKRSIRMAPFTAALFRRDLFGRIGVLDERFESYLEDVDFGMRCALAGFGGVYVPDAVARHQGSATLGKWHPDTVQRMARNQVLLVAKHFPENWAWRYGWAILVGQTLWGLVALRHGAGLAWIRGKWAGCRLYWKLRDANSRGNVDQILRESEAVIRDLQTKTGFNWYWKLYFGLT